jgi:transposase
MACVAAAEQPNLPGRSLERALSLPGKPFGKGLHLIESGGHRTIVVGRLAIYDWDVAEVEEENLAAAIVLRGGLATQVELAEVLGRHRNTIYRLNRRARERGLSGVVREKPGPKAPYKVTAAVREAVAKGVAEGRDARGLGELVVERTGVVLGGSVARRRHARHLINGYEDEPAFTTDSADLFQFDVTCPGPTLSAHPQKWQSPLVYVSCRKPGPFRRVGPCQPTTHPYNHAEVPPTAGRQAYQSAPSSPRLTEEVMDHGMIRRRAWPVRPP